MQLPFAESYRIKMVERIRCSTRQERELWLESAKYNFFNLKGYQVFIDLLTDSGSGAMSDKQWAAIMEGDEIYAGSSSFDHMAEAIQKIMGFKYILPAHQGRAAEHVLFSATVLDGDVVPGNSHFDTTVAHLGIKKATAIECGISGAYDPNFIHPFKGNVGLAKLEDVLSTNPSEQIPMIIVTVTCNKTGGQPVSMENLRAVKELADKYGVPVCFDAARFSENAYFIKTREKGYADKSMKEIVFEMFSYADMTTVSCKKDVYANIGGFVAMRDKDLWRKASVFTAIYEGFMTYGGLSGRDMNAIAQGIYETIEFDNLETRIKQVEYLGHKLEEYGIPIIKPIGGHCIVVDAGALLPNVPKNEFPAQTLSCELYLEAGIRSLERGSLSFPGGKDREYLRLAIPRRTYTNNHMNVVAVSLRKGIRSATQHYEGIDNC